MDDFSRQVRVQPKSRAERAVLNRDLARLEDMSTDELKDEYFATFSHGSNCRNRKWLIRRVFNRLQALQDGGLTPQAKGQITKLNRDVVLSERPSDRPGSTSRPRDPRLPPEGTKLTKRYEGQTYVVAVVADGFRYDRRHFRTLSAVAKEITGNHWNGFLFFGLDTRKPKKKRGAK